MAVWGEDGGLQEVEGEATDENVSAFLAKASEDWSASLSFERDRETLVISASEGRYAVALMTHSQGDSGSIEDCFDLLDDADAVGFLDFAHDGQWARHPARHVHASTVGAERVAQQFIAGTTLEKLFGAWERQGAHESATVDQALVAKPSHLS
jgi:hypothetical protein